MPIYEYACSACGTAVERLRKHEERERPIACPSCGSPARPVFSAAAVRSGGSAPIASGCGPGCCGGGCATS